MSEEKYILDQGAIATWDKLVVANPNLARMPQIWFSTAIDEYTKKREQTMADNELIEALYEVVADLCTEVNLINDHRRLSESEVTLDGAMATHTSDIVGRLRGYDFLRDGDYPEIIMAEAAAEIERLEVGVARRDWQISGLIIRCAELEADIAEGDYAYLRAEIERLHVLNEERQFLVEGIVEAITNKGSRPDYHDRTLNHQRRLHPILWNHLDKLVQSTCGITLTNGANWRKPPAAKKRNPDEQNPVETAWDLCTFCGYMGTFKAGGCRRCGHGHFA